MTLIVMGRRRGGSTAPAYVAPDWELLRDFNAGPSGSSTSNVADGFSGDASASVYTTEQVYAGAYSCKMTITAGTGGTGAWGGRVNFPTTLVKGDTLWYQHYYYMPDAYVIETDPNWLKYLRFLTKNSGGTSIGYLDLYLNDDDAGTPATTYRWIYEPQSVWTTTGPNRRFLRDQWVRQTVRVDISDVTIASGGTGRVRFWENGTLLTDSTTLKTLDTATDYYEHFLLHTYWNNGNAPRTQSSYVDDIRIAKNGRPSWVLDIQGVT